jgi:hypothetical protein
METIEHFATRVCQNLPEQAAFSVTTDPYQMLGGAILCVWDHHTLTLMGKDPSHQDSDGCEVYTRFVLVDQDADPGDLAAVVQAVEARLAQDDDFVGACATARIAHDIAVDRRMDGPVGDFVARARLT